MEGKRYRKKKKKKSSFLILTRKSVTRKQHDRRQSGSSALPAAWIKTLNECGLQKPLFEHMQEKHARALEEEEEEEGVKPRQEEVWMEKARERELNFIDSKKNNKKMQILKYVALHQISQINSCCCRKERKNILLYCILFCTISILGYKKKNLYWPRPSVWILRGPCGWSIASEVNCVFA